MLSPADADLARRDRTIPGLATVLDSDAFLAALRSHLPGLGLRGIHPTYVHYKPLTRCMVAYRITTADAELIAYADAYGPDAKVKLKKAYEIQRNTAGPHGPGALVMEDLATAVYFFPTDRRLNVLRHLASADKTRKLLRMLFPGQKALKEGTLHPLRYKPERRYVARLDTAQGPRAVVKFYTPAGYTAAKAGAQAFVSRGALRLARTAGYSDRHHILAFEWQPGRLLRDILVAGEVRQTDKAAAMQLTGAALAELHAHPAGGLGQRTHEAELRRLRAQAATLEQLCPKLSHAARRLVRRIVARLLETPAAALALHSDFYDQQVLITDDAAMILDLDQTEIGDPAADLGLFIAHLERAELQNRLSAETLEMLADTLVRSYRQARPGPPTPATIRLYTAIGLFYLAAEPFRHLEPDWPERIAALLSRADKVLDSLGTPAQTTAWRDSGSRRLRR
jgi:hypothetical protein